MRSYSKFEAAKEYVKELIRSNKTDYSDLSNDELGCLTGLIMRDLDNDARMELVSCAKDSDSMTLDLSRYLISFDRNEFPAYGDFMTNQKECGVDVLKSITDNAINSAKHYIDQLFVDVLEEFVSEREPESYNDLMEDFPSRTGTHA